MCLPQRVEHSSYRFSCFTFLGDYMPVLGNDFAVVTNYVRKLRGGSQPILAQASDGHQYVVKFSNNLQGPNLLFNESMGYALYRACNLPVPIWKPLLLTDFLIDQNPDCWMVTTNGRLRPTPGLCFGSRFLGEGGARFLEILPGNAFERVRNRASFWLARLIDICAEQTDNRQAIFCEDANGGLSTTFVDQGNFFGGPKADLKKRSGASSYLDPRIYPKLSSEELLGFKKRIQEFDSDSLWRQVVSIPADWRYKTALDSFRCCLQRLSEPVQVQHILDSVIDAHEQRTQKKPGNVTGEQNSIFEVRRSGIQSEGFRGNYAHHPARA
jgi:hypothetical protein